MCSVWSKVPQPQLSLRLAHHKHLPPRVVYDAIADRAQQPASQRTDSARADHHQIHLELVGVSDDRLRGGPGIDDFLDLSRWRAARHLVEELVGRLDFLWRRAWKLEKRVHWTHRDYPRRPNPHQKPQTPLDLRAHLLSKLA